MAFYKIVTRKRYVDKRGQLVEYLTRKETGEKIFGHIYFVTFAKKGIVRGNHYHKKKKEFFGLVQGKVKILLEDIKTGKKRKYILNAKSEKFELLIIEPYVAHAVESLEKGTILVDYFTKPFDLKNPDDYNHKLI
ncbi:MAG: hypothetical protein US96_C0035G0008 [Candidatus Woesebacteria bacterium GW2011_GWB1_38_5b]|uniref:Capsular polysaccharide assembling protein CapF C-terminal domain-containing protein n=1 Tax=Candidatus Woesebacteria bacterium GW2011_GWB1_38_5b TaxID=1618569 RepID=A0A0G0MKQ9_9BACT|nr:MAG: hypothetical protein US96_C0035G0008 [Candidatus Woesebacteria bacterium GW2011_GWB1_38_5b]